MKIYVAGPWVHKSDLKVIADQLRYEGFEVTSRWHDTTLNSNIYEAAPRVMQDEAQKDYDDLTKADTIVYMNLTKSEGKATELGIGLARGYTIYAVGGRQGNVFLHMPQIIHFNTFNEVMETLNASRSK